MKNIYNEFVIYHNRLNTTELDCNKMLAIIAYKNLFPRDFADLQLNQGFVFTLFNKKETFIESEIAATKEIINETQRRISSLKNEELVSMRELNAIFADKYLSNYNSWSQKNNDDLADFIEGHLNGDRKKEYEARKQILEDKLNKKEARLYQDIKNLEQKVIEIQSRRLNQIITRDNIDAIFSITSTNEIGEAGLESDIQDEAVGYDQKNHLIKIRKLNKKIGDNLKRLYQYRCQICGRLIGEEYGSHVVEAHHIEYFVKSLNNDASNQIIVCTNHHSIIHDVDPVFDRKRLLYIYPNGFEEKFVLNMHL